MKILLIEDDPQVSRAVCGSLAEHGHEVVHEADGLAALQTAAAQQFSLIITDRMLPGADGIAIVKALREHGNNVPVLIVSALATVDDRVAGLRAGADDYLAKPFEFVELLARVDALLRRRSTEGSETVLRAADVEMNLVSRKVTRAGRELALTPREFRLLEFLLRNSGQIVTRNMLLEKVWDVQFDPQSNLVEVHVSRLRNVVDKGFEHSLIQTVRGAGYLVRG